MDHWGNDIYYGKFQTTLKEMPVNVSLQDNVHNSCHTSLKKNTINAWQTNNTPDVIIIVIWVSVRLCLGLRDWKPARDLPTNKTLCWWALHVKHSQHSNNSKTSRE